MKNKIWIAVVFLLIAMYAGFIFLISQKNSGEKPVISFDEDNLEVSVKDGDEVLLKGVHAFDQEDGNLDQEIVIDSISKFDDDNDRIVTYAVFDSEANVTKAQRKIHYSDYTKVNFYLNESFSSNTLNTATIAGMIKAKSCIDGDISDSVIADLHVDSDSGEVIVTAEVEDSTGDRATIELPYTRDNNNYTTKIQLKSYLVYVKKGQKFDAEKNLDSIEMSSIGKSDADSYLNIDDSKVDYDHSGVYEILYTFNYYGDNGFSKCIVVVE